MPHILLLGAGFSRNWGGWLADEAFEYLLGHPRIDDSLRSLLWRYKGQGGFEAAYDEQQTETSKPGRSVAMLDDAQRLDEAIRGMFADMDKAFAELDGLDFGDTPDGPVTEFLDKFDAIFTLNQDLLIERQYKANDMARFFRPKGWHMPGMEPMTEPPGTAIKDVKEWRPMDRSKFAVEGNLQPYFKLHGSSNWVDHSSGHSMLVIGGNKPFAIARHEILMWNYQQFREYLSRPGTRLMVIGYSFGDDHINNAIGTAADGGSLQLFIIDPDGVDVLDKDHRMHLFWKPEGGSEIRDVRGPLLIRFQDHLIGASRRTMRDIFGGDMVEHGKVMRFFTSA